MFRCKACEIPGSEAYSLYVATTRNESNAVDGCFPPTAPSPKSSRGSSRGCRNVRRFRLYGLEAEESYWYVR